MKKLLLILSVIFTLATISTAQELGVRFGDVSGGNVAIDGIIGIGSWSRVHADVSFGDGVGIDAKEVHEADGAARLAASTTDG